MKLIKFCLNKTKMHQIRHTLPTRSLDDLNLTTARLCSIPCASVSTCECVTSRQGEAKVTAVCGHTVKAIAAHRHCAIGNGA